MNKRGQLYIFAALILCVVLFLLVGKRMLVSQESMEDDFELLSSNYNYEAAKFINALLAGGSKAVEDEFIEFTSDFTAYSKNQNPDFMLIYVFKHKEINPETLLEEDRIYLGNYLNIPILVKSGVDYERVDGCFAEIEACVSIGQTFKTCEGLTSGEILQCTRSFDAGYPLFIIINGVEYEFSVGSGSPEIVIVSRESLNEQRKVFMNDEFVWGSKKGDDVNELGDYVGEGTEGDMCELLHGDDRYSCEKDTSCTWNDNTQMCEE